MSDRLQDKQNDGVHAWACEEMALEVLRTIDP